MRKSPKLAKVNFGLNRKAINSYSQETVSETSLSLFEAET